MYTTDLDRRKHRAEYVCEAVDGRRVKSGETTEIPIPHSDSGVEALLDTLRSDYDTIAETDIDELGEAVNDRVYEMFSITPEDQSVIEEYLRRSCERDCW